MEYELKRYLIAATLSAGALLFPPIFLLFIPIVAMSIYKVLKEEYEDVFTYWHKKWMKASRKKAKTVKCKFGKSPLKPAAEMV